MQTGDNVMIGGFIVQGTEPKRVIVRAIGPELGGPPYNIPNALANPTLELHNGTGDLIASNDNWRTTIIGGIIMSSQVRDILASGRAPADGRESAIIADLPPDNYTAIVRGVNDTTGVGLVEVYDLALILQTLMKKKSTTQSARALIVLLVCGAACSIVTGTLPTTAGKLAFFRTETPARVSHPAAAALTFAERVSYQRAIEDVYWRHRIWPKERPDPKPLLDAVMTQTQLESKVADYLRNSQTLEDYWQRPITADQLQAEMERMAHHTKQPEVLDELFEALGNDPFVIAECLARPALAERLLTNWYAYDQRIHGELKQRAEADLQSHLAAVASAETSNTIEQMKQLSGKYSEMEFVKSDSSDGATNGGTEHALKLDSREWDQNVEELAAAFNRASTAELAEGYETVPVGKLSSLQEDENGYYATAVIEKGKNRLRLATVTWQKKPLGSWVANAQKQLPATDGSDWR